MDPVPSERTASGGARGKLLDAAISVIRRKGYAATSVDELCASAGVTKGAFFYHFPSKDSLAVAAANYWAELSDAHFAGAPYHQLGDPLDRVLGYLDFRKELVRGEIAEFSCLAGTMVQETYGTHPHIRRACEATISGHAAGLESEIAEALTLYDLRAPWTAASLALHMQAVLQGAFILAKATGDASVAEASVDHLRRYIELLFHRPGNKGAGTSRPRRKLPARTGPNTRGRQRPKARSLESWQPLTADGRRRGDSAGVAFDRGQECTPRGSRSTRTTRARRRR